MSVTIGNFDRLDARGSYDISLIKDRVFARFAFSSKKADGWFHVLDYVCVHGPKSLGTGGPGLPNGPYGVPGGYPGGLPGIHLTSAVGPGGNCDVATQNNENVQSGRAAFRILTSSNSELNIIADLTSQRQEGPADKYSVIDGTNGLNQFWNAAFVAPVYGAGVAWDSRFVTNSMYTSYGAFNDPLTGRKVPNINNMDHWGVSAAFDWDITDNMHFKSVTAYRRFWNKFGRDSDGSPLPNNFTYDDSRHRQFTQELRLTGKAGNAGLGGRRVLLRRVRFEPRLRRPVSDGHLPAGLLRYADDEELGDLHAGNRALHGQVLPDRRRALHARREERADQPDAISSAVWSSTTTTCR